MELVLRHSQAKSYRIKLLSLYYSLQDLTLWFDVTKIHRENPPQIIIFKSSGVDNIDHNPSSTTATGSLHGTAIIRALE